jgi:hypothetical protein
MGATYRRKKGSDTWHFTGSCSKWPTSNYDEQESPPRGELCNECLAKATAPTPWQPPARRRRV